MRQYVLAALVLASCSKPAPPAPPAPADGGPEKVKVVSKGEGYSLTDQLVPGYVTILYFTADW